MTSLWGTKTACTSGKPTCYCLMGRTRPLERISMEDGSVLEEFCSGSDASEKLGLTKSEISGHASGRVPGPIKGKFILRYKQGMRGSMRGVAKAVERITASGDVIQRYHSATDAASRLGLSSGMIGRVCNGRQPDVKGFLFRWARNDEYTPTSTSAHVAPIPACIPAEQDDSDRSHMDIDDSTLPELIDFLADIGLSEYVPVLEDEDFTLPVMIASLNDKNDVNGWLLANLVEMGMSRQKCRRLIQQLRSLPGVDS